MLPLYTSQGTNKILEKISEESEEVIMAAKNERQKRNYS